MKKETKKLDILYKEMKECGFSVSMAYTNRLRILDAKLDNFIPTSENVKESINNIVNKTYEEMYDYPDMKPDDDSLEGTKTRAKRFEMIYDALTEFSKLDQKDRKEFIETHKPKMKCVRNIPAKVIDFERGRA